MDQSPGQSIGDCVSGDCGYQWTSENFTSWQNHCDHWPQTAIKTTMHPWIENTKRNRDARREFNALPHARGHDPGGQRLGRRLDQNSRSMIVQQAQAGFKTFNEDRVWPTLVQSRRATHPRFETQSPRPGLDRRDKSSQTHRQKYL